MKQVININFQGRIVPIEVTAFEKVKEYIESLKKHFANEEGRDEIINDIEGRIGELFDVKIKKGSSCITDADVDSVIESIGRPEQFDSEKTEAGTQNNTSHSASEWPPQSKKLFRNESDKLLGGVCSGLAAYFNIDVVIVRILFLIFFGPLALPYIILWIVLPGSAGMVLGTPGRRLFRDTDEKLIAGVCSGIGKYLGINAWIPRIIFLLPMLGFIFNWSERIFGFTDLTRFTLSPGSVAIYLILWLVIPRARTAAEKLQMRGEKVDINSIRNTVVQEARQFEQKASKWGKEFSADMKAKAGEVEGEVNDLAKKSGNGFVRLFRGIAKAILYIIVGFFFLIALVVMFSIAISFIAIFPLRDFVITTSWQDTLSWISLFLLVILPLIASIVWIIRRIIRARSHSKALRISFATLWIIGLISGGLLVASVAGEFRHRARGEYREIKLSAPAAQSLTIVPTAGKYKYTQSDGDINITPGELFYIDSLPVDDVEVKLLRSEDDSFRVFMSSSAFGRTRADAEIRANSIFPSFETTDSTLIIDPNILITRKDKYRGQEVDIKVYVPVGKKLNTDPIFDTDRRGIIDLID